METVRKTAIWTGIVLIGLCGIVLLGGGKIVSGTLLVITAFVMVLPIWRHTSLRWLMAVLTCAIFGLVIWNISTTDLPAPSDGMVVACTESAMEVPPSTGIKFFDQVAYIFSGFLSQAEGS